MKSECSKQKRILVVFGTRPEAIKMCPVVLELKRRSALETFVCVSGQHRQMLDQVLSAFGIQPDFDLNIMQERQSLDTIVTSVLKGLASVLEDVDPDVVLVHGDTTTTFAVSLACFHAQIPVGHVEAGLRTRNLAAPFPEEFNRQAVDIVSTYLFAPTELAAHNLIEEKKDPKAITVTGNTAIDALNTTVSSDCPLPEAAWLAESRLLLITAHRRENLGEPMRRMFKAILRVLNERPNVKVIYPVHMNPLVREVAHDVFGECKQIRLIEPLDVVSFHNLMARSQVILTDSGGIQEEAPSLGIPVLVMRDVTERPEGIAAGTLKLVGTEEESIYEAIGLLLDDEVEHERMSSALNPYGDGKASVRIADVLEGKNVKPFYTASSQIGQIGGLS